MDISILAKPCSLCFVLSLCVCLIFLCSSACVFVCVPFVSQHGDLKVVYPQHDLTAREEDYQNLK